MMNNIGNQMFVNNNGMNPMFMNNINEMNNNQPNLMDADALRIRNIILPYENKIKELEEVIRQKDFEIALLKDKLNNKGNNNFHNIINPMMMNMNNMMIGNNNNNFQFEKGKEISIFFNNSKYNCFENEETYKLFEKIDDNNGFYWHLKKYKIGEKNINPFIRINQNKIVDGSVIDINPCKSLSFNGNFQAINITIDSDYPIKKAIKYFLLKLGKEGEYTSYYFLFNGKKLDIEDKSPIKKIFKQTHHSIQCIPIKNL